MPHGRFWDVFLVYLDFVVSVGRWTSVFTSEILDSGVSSNTVNRKVARQLYRATLACHDCIAIVLKQLAS
jgi:hypothetical protein